MRGLNLLAAPKPPLRADVAIVGAGEAATACLARMSPTRLARTGKTIVISHDPWSWVDRFPRHHRMGQPAGVLSSRPDQLYAKKQNMELDRYRRELVNRQIEAVEGFGDEALDYHEAAALQILKTGAGVEIKCSDGTWVECRKAVLCTGLGPERTLSNCGVQFLNRPAERRRIADEVTTMLVAQTKNRDFFEGKTIVLYGGGASAAWSAEKAIENGAAGLLWVSMNGFAGANPGGRNNEIMQLTEDCRQIAQIKTLQYLGSLGATGGGLELQLDPGKGKRRSAKADVVIAAAGQDPLAPTGIRRLMPPGIYDALMPLPGLQKGGFCAVDPSGSILLTAPAVATDPRFSDSFRTLFGELEREFGSIASSEVLRIGGGIMAARYSGGAAGDIAAGEVTLEDALKGV